MRVTTEGTIINSHAVLRRDFVAGMRFVAPWLVSLLPFGMVIGVSAAQADVPALVGWFTGAMIYAGSAQLAAIQMLDAGAAPLAVVATTMVINLRLVMYSAAMATYWRGTPLWFRLLAGYLLVDPSFVAGIERYAKEPDVRRGHAHYLGAALLVWLTWLAAIAVGATAGGRLPGWLHLEMLFPLFLIGEIVPKLRDVATRRAVLAAAAVGLACLAIPMRLGIVAGIAAGMAAGMVVSPRPRTHVPSTKSTEERPHEERDA